MLQKRALCRVTLLLAESVCSLDFPPLVDGYGLLEHLTVGTRVFALIESVCGLVVIALVSCMTGPLEHLTVDNWIGSLSE